MTNHNSPCVFEEVMSCVRVFCGSRANAENIDCEQSLIRQRAVSYFSLQSYCTRNLSTRAAKPRAARNEGVSLVWSQSLIVIITSWFAIALDEIRTRRILREKADCKQSRENMAEDALRKEWDVFGLERLSKHQEEALRLLG